MEKDATACIRNHSDISEQEFEVIYNAMVGMKKRTMTRHFTMDPNKDILAGSAMGNNGKEANDGINLELNDAENETSVITTSPMKSRSNLIQKIIAHTKLNLDFDDAHRTRAISRVQAGSTVSSCSVSRRDVVADGNDGLGEIYEWNQ